MRDQPHIVIFNPDQWRGDVLGYAGNPAAVTPNLDRLVNEEAVGFSQAYCQAPVCTPSRCSFMTGWYPHVAGHRSMTHMLRPHEPVLLRSLREAGYFVWWGGKNDLVPGQNGYEGYCDIKYEPPGEPQNIRVLGPGSEWRGEPGSDTYYSFYVGRLETKGEPYPLDHDWGYVLGALDFIRQAPADRPLCLYLPLGYPHPPYGVEDPWFSAIDREALPPRLPAPDSWEGKPSLLKWIWERQGLQGWSEERWTELRATYYGMCARVDHQLGLVIQALREAGLWDDTALFFFADHGDFTGDYGLVEKTQNTFEDCLTHVPLVVKPPAGRAVRPGVNSALAELIDVPATVEDWTGLPPEHTHFGRSLAPLIAGETDQHRDAVFCQGGRRHGERQVMELLGPGGTDTQPDFPYWPRLSAQQLEGPEHTRAIMCRTARYKYVRRLYERDELYDLSEDPAELHNRSGDPALAGVEAELKDRLLTCYLETSDVVPPDLDLRW